MMLNRILNIFTIALSILFLLMVLIVFSGLLKALITTGDMHQTFDWCVVWMEENCKSFGLDYKKFNMVLFVILQPLLILLLILSVKTKLIRNNFFHN
jgi:NADH:ubiquinone oxidoreductase subunit 3 (subunit A)